MKISFSGILDTDSMELIFEKFQVPKSPGRPPAPARLAALVLADAWASSNFTPKKLSKETRIHNALIVNASTKGYSDGGSQRRAVSNAKKKENTLFPPPHKPGLIIYGRVGAVWFSDKATHYPDEVVGFGWVWRPGMSNAVFKVVKATKEGN